MSQAAAPSVPGERMSESIARQLEEQIVSGELARGEPLPVERELMQRYGVSRGVVREAIFKLQARGFVTGAKGARTRATMPSAGSMLPQLGGAARLLLEDPMGMLHFQEARGFFEAALVRYAARHATPKQIEMLGVALEANRKALNDPNEFARTDVLFHSRLAEIPNNPIFVALDKAFSDWLLAQREQAMKVGSREVGLRQHELVLDAIVRRDPDAAEAAMSTHLQTVSKYYWQTLPDPKPSTP
jgi:DNA-binding FadR family transcriptional regulator